MTAADRPFGHELEIALFRVVAQAVPSFVSCIDRQRRVLFLNRTLSRELSAVLGKPMEQFVSAPHREAVIDSIEAAFTSGDPRDRIHGRDERWDATPQPHAHRAVPRPGR